MDPRIAAWFDQQKSGRAPEPLLAAVVQRTRSTPQRRGLRAWRPSEAGRGREGRWLAFGALAAAAVVVLAVATFGVIGPDPLRGIVGGPNASQPAATAPAATPDARPSASPTPSPSRRPSPSPSLALDDLRIVFTETGGVYTTVCCFAPGETLTPGTGTFSMTGAWSSDGTFTDSVIYAPDGTYSVTRTMTMPSGRLEASAVVRTLTNGQSMVTRGTWRLTGGTGPWAEVAASGELTGLQGTMVSQFTNKPSTETWTGTVQR